MPREFYNETSEIIQMVASLYKVYEDVSVVDVYIMQHFHSSLL